MGLGVDASALATLPGAVEYILRSTQVHFQLAEAQGHRPTPCETCVAVFSAFDALVASAVEKKIRAWDWAVVLHKEILHASLASNHEQFATIVTRVATATMGTQLGVNVVVALYAVLGRGASCDAVSRQCGVDFSSYHVWTLS